MFDTMTTEQKDFFWDKLCDVVDHSRVDTVSVTVELLLELMRSHHELMTRNYLEHSRKAHRKNLKESTRLWERKCSNRYYNKSELAYALMQGIEIHRVESYRKAQTGKK